MINPLTFLKQPIKFNNICLVYPPSVNEVITTDEFSQYEKLLTYTEEELSDDITERFEQLKEEKPKDFKMPTPFEYLFANSQSNKEFEELAKKAFKFFLHEDVIFIYQIGVILIGAVDDLSKVSSVDELRKIDQNNYFDFQNRIRECVGQHIIEKPKEESKAVKAIRAKARRRERIAARSRLKNGNGISLTTYLAAICCMNMGLNPLNIGEISYAAMNILLDIYSAKEKYEIDIKSLLAGADPKKVKPKYWIRDKSDNEVEVKI